MRASVKIQIKHPSSKEWEDLGEISSDLWDASSVALESMVKFSHPKSILRALDESNRPRLIWSEKTGWRAALYVISSSRRAA